jgi:hypothetical protein
MCYAPPGPAVDHEIAVGSRTTSTEQCARAATEAETLPSKKRLNAASHSTISVTVYSVSSGGMSGLPLTMWASLEPHETLRGTRFTGSEIAFTQSG